MMMKSKIGWARLVSLAILLAALTAQAANPSVMPKFSDCSCNAPASITLTGQTGDSVSFSWSGVSGASGYRVWYERSEDQYTSSYTTVLGTSTGYSELPAGTYTFHVATVCNELTVSEGIILEDLLIG